MQDNGGIGLQQVINDVTSFAVAKGRDRTFEFALYLLKWQAELATKNDNKELEVLVLREAAELKRQIECMSTAA